MWKKRRVLTDVSLRRVPSSTDKFKGTIDGNTEVAPQGGGARRRTSPAEATLASASHRLIYE